MMLTNELLKYTLLFEIYLNTVDKILRLIIKKKQGIK